MCSESFAFQDAIDVQMTDSLPKELCCAAEALDIQDVLEPHVWLIFALYFKIANQ